MCLQTCKDGFFNYCRPFIGLYDSYLNGLFSGALLITISLNANNSLFLIAYMATKREN